MISLVAASSLLLPFMVMVAAMVWSSLINSLTSPTRPALYPLHESPYTRVILLLAALVETWPACFAPAHANAAFPWSSPWSLSWARHALPCPCLAFPIPMASLHVLHICTCSLALHTRLRLMVHTLHQSYTVLHTRHAHQSINPLSFHTHASSPTTHPCPYQNLLSYTYNPTSLYMHRFTHPSIHSSTTLPSIVEEEKKWPQT
jgi:hypothetical protein